MIVVAFQPRAGSSCKMQVLHGAGIPIVGEKFPHWMGLEMREHNPNGYWESVETTRGLRQDIGACAIKILISALLDQSEIPMHAKIILCTRDPEAQAQSQHRTMLGNTHDLRYTRLMNARYYELFWSWAKERMVHVFNHEDWLKNPDAERARLLQVVA